MCCPAYNGWCIDGSYYFPLCPKQFSDLVRGTVKNPACMVRDDECGDLSCSQRACINRGF